MQLLDDARDKILMGAPRALTQTDEARRLTAYHEGGHALVALLTPGAKPIHKARAWPDAGLLCACSGVCVAERTGLRCQPPSHTRTLPPSTRHRPTPSRHTHPHAPHRTAPHPLALRPQSSPGVTRWAW